MSQFVEMLGDLMFDNNLNSVELAEKTGIAPNTLTQYLQDVRFPSLQSVILLADYFQCSTDFLLGLEPESNHRCFAPCPPFNKRLEFILKSKGYTGYRFCKESRINESGFYKWLNGKRVPSVDNVIKIAKFLEISVDYLLGREN